MIKSFLDSVFEYIIPQKELLILSDLQFLHTNRDKVLGEDQHESIDHIMGIIKSGNKESVYSLCSSYRDVQFVSQTILTNTYEKGC